MDNGHRVYSVLFVCLGNICRSPAGEAVFKDIVRRRGLEAMFYVDSAGTIGFNAGNPADWRMKEAAEKRGINITSIARQIVAADFNNFDLIIAMDNHNRDDIIQTLEMWKAREEICPFASEKIRMMCSYCKRHSETEVPDPYYGGPRGFEMVLDLVEDACESLLDSILNSTSP